MVVTVTKSSSYQFGYSNASFVTGRKHRARLKAFPGEHNVPEAVPEQFIRRMTREDIRRIRKQEGR